MQKYYFLRILKYAEGKSCAVCIKKPYYYKFNNSAIFADNVENEDDDEDFEMIKMFWKLGMDNFTKFINRIKLMNSKSLRLTKEVLKILFLG